MPERQNPDFTLEDHISGEVGERVRSIIRAAESAAQAIRQEADEQIRARQRLAEDERARYLDAARREADELLRRRVSRMSELSDSLIEGAAQMLREMEGATELRNALDRTVSALAETADRLLDDARHSRIMEPEPEPEPEADGPKAAVTPITPRADDSADADEPVDAEVVNGGERDEPPLDLADDRSSDDDMLAARLVALQMAVAGSSRGEVEEHLRVHFAVEDITSILNDVFGSDVPGVAH